MTNEETNKESNNEMKEETNKEMNKETDEETDVVTIFLCGVPKGCESLGPDILWCLSVVFVYVDVGCIGVK